MLLSLLWDEIVADDMMMFSVKVMKLLINLLISNVLLKLNSKSYHVVKEKGIIYDAILKTRHERNSKIFFFLSPCLVLIRRGLARMVENVMWKFQKLNFASTNILTLVKSTLAETNSRSEHFSVPFPYKRILE